MMMMMVILKGQMSVVSLLNYRIRLTLGALCDALYKSTTTTTTTTTTTVAYYWLSYKYRPRVDSCINNFMHFIFVASKQPQSYYNRWRHFFGRSVYETNKLGLINKS